MTRLWLLPILLFGCGRDFDPYNRLTSLRVMAIQSEPPAPAPGETALLTPLVYVPASQAAPTYAWSWCPLPGSAGEGFRCRVTEAELSALAGVEVPPFDLGAEPFARFAHTLAPEALERVCQGIPGTPLIPDCEGGFPVQIRMTVRTEADEVVTVRTLRLRFAAAHEPNRNPRIEGLLARIDGADQPIEATPALTLPRHEDTVIKAVVSESEAETHTDYDDLGNARTVTERLILSWFVESGDTKEQRTGTLPGEVPLARAVENEWKPAKTEDYPDGTARLFVVLRDSRGGVSWIHGAVLLGAAP